MLLRKIVLGLLVALTLALATPRANAQFGRFYPGRPNMAPGGYAGGYYGSPARYMYGYGGPMDYGYGDYTVGPSLYDSGYGNNGYGYDNTAYPQAIPRTSDAITVRRESGNRIYIAWRGEPRAVASMTFALLDSKGRIIKQQPITSLPAEARFTRTRNTAYYGVYIQYIDGTTNSVIAPI